MDSVLNLSTVHESENSPCEGPFALRTCQSLWRGIAIMDIDGARATFGKEDKLDRIDIVTTPGADVETVATRLRTTLGASYTIAAPEGQSQGMQRWWRAFKRRFLFSAPLLFSSASS